MHARRMRPRAGARRARDERHRFARVARGREQRLEPLERRERKRRARRVMRLERAGRARRGCVAAVGQARRDAKHVGDLPRAHMARAQQRRKAARQIENRRFDADVGRAAIEHMDGIAELVAHVLRGGRAHVAEAVRRRRGDAAVPAAPRVERAQQRLRDRMRRTAQADRVLPAAHRVRNVRGALQDQRERAGPERVDQLLRVGGQRFDPITGIAARREMDDHRMVRRPPFRRVDARDGGRVLRVGAEPVDGLGRKRDELARIEPRGRVLDGLGAREGSIVRRHRALRQSSAMRNSRAHAVAPATASSRVAAVKFTWPILRPARASSLPYRCSRAVGIAATSSHGGVTGSPDTPFANHTSPSTLSIAAGECWRVLPSGSRVIARTCCSNWLVSHASTV
ncbi:hypothetical protein BURPS1710b_1002 [Burkholderia pseudomallei 1710b]|uniref:Uncharacterized protein n=1 Tax=Burkholderia pseudomallei (strain 1710b) TaxID=320372 RepID=Q3JVI9_BURP1|nr:hypothetical protein BURPS1710b_1002 [Burkholderia pseudomallei 1710b]